MDGAAGPRRAVGEGAAHLHHGPLVQPVVLVVLGQDVIDGDRHGHALDGERVAMDVRRLREHIVGGFDASFVLCADRAFRRLIVGHLGKHDGVRIHEAAQLVDMGREAGAEVRHAVAVFQRPHPEIVVF